MKRFTLPAAAALVAVMTAATVSAEIVQSDVPADLPTRDAVDAPAGVAEGSAAAAYLAHVNAIRTGDLDAAVALVHTASDAEVRHVRQRLLVAMVNEALETAAFPDEEPKPSEVIGVPNAPRLAELSEVERPDGTAEVRYRGCRARSRW